MMTGALVSRPRLHCMLLLAMLLAAAPTAASAGRNLLHNGDFAKGSGDQPDEWRTEAWINKPEAFMAHWHPGTNGQPSEVEVDNLQPDDGRWEQSISLTPGWYQISVDLRAEDVGANETGANISVMEDGIVSEELHGTSDWKHVTLYLKVGGKGADVDVALRVGGFGSLNKGRGFFRNATLEKIEAPPPRATPTFDLTEIRKQAAPVPIGKTYSMVLTFLLLAAIGYVGWFMFEYYEPAPEGAQAPPKSRKSKRK